MAEGGGPSVLISGVSNPEVSLYTIDDALSCTGFGLFQWLLLGYAGLAWMADAMEVMLLSYLGPEVTCHWGLSPVQEGMLTSVVFLGMMLGALLWGALSDSRGRRAAFAVTAMCTAACALLSAVAPSYTALLLLRCAVGVGLAGVPVVFTLLLEYCPPAGRGTALVAIELFWTVGTVGQAGLAWLVLPRWGWRVLLAISSLPLVLLLSLYPLLPESAHWLLASGRLAEAQEALEAVARINIRSLPKGQLASTHSAPIAARRPQRLRLAVRLQALVQDVAAAVRQLLSRHLRRVTLLLAAAWFCTALAYYGIVMLATELKIHDDDRGCKGASFSWHASDFRGALIDATAELPALAWAAATVDSIGRRWSTGLSLVGTSIGMGVLVVVPGGTTTTTALLFVARLFVMAAFTTLWVYTPELYPTPVRNLGLGVCNSIARLGGFLAPMVAVVMVREGMSRAGEAIIALLAALAVVCVALQRRETKGHALEDEVESTISEARPQYQGADLEYAEAAQRLLSRTGTPPELGMGPASLQAPLEPSPGWQKGAPSASGSPARRRPGATPSPPRPRAEHYRVLPEGGEDALRGSAHRDGLHDAHDAGRHQ